MISVELDLVLIKSLLTRGVFDKYYSLVDLSTLSEEARYILSALQQYYAEKTAALECPIKTLTPYFLSLHNNWAAEQQEYYKNVISRILDIEKEDIEIVVADLRKRALWKKLNDIKDKDFDTKKMEDVIQKFNSQHLADGAVKFLKYDEWIHQDALKGGGYQWRLNHIQQAWGNMRPKQLYLVTATTHTGKSSFMVSEMSHLCKQITDNSTILHFNNERSESSVLERYLCGYFKCSIDKIREHREKAIEKFLKNHPNMPIRIFSARDGKKTLREIEAACSLYKPAAVIIDVIDKLIQSTEGARRPYEYVFSWARDLAIKYDTIVMGATQYGITTDRDGNVTTPKMSQHGAFDAKVDKAANTDFMLGIQNVPMNPAQKRIYLLRAKEGEEDLNFYCKFDKVTGIFDN